MNTRTTTEATQTLTPFTTTERRALRALQTRYNPTTRVFSDHELTQLRFLRWLVQTGRLTR